MTTAAAPAKVGPAEVMNEVKTLREEFAQRDAARQKEMEEWKQKTSVPQYPPGANPFVMVAPVGAPKAESRGYSILKMAGLAVGAVSEDECKEEIEVHNRLKDLYRRAGWRAETRPGVRSWLVPYCTSHLPMENSADEKFVGDLRQKMVAHADRVDPDEMAWLEKKCGIRTKDLGTISDTTGGVVVGFPTLMELIDIQRNLEVFTRAGATEVALPANGRMQYPKLTNTTTAFWVGEGMPITESTPATGYLDLQAKKLGILTDINNELIRFASITAEAMLRTDMAKVAALKADLAMLEGTGGTQIKGLITYPSASSWTTGTDPLLTHAVTSNLLQVKDAAEAEALLPDTAGEPTAWVMRRNLFAKLRNRRASAVSAGDAEGPYLADITRSLSQRLRYEWDGTPVVRSSQVSNTRGNGSQTYALLGYFPDWIIARFGVLEFLSSNVSDQALANDQTRLRCIQHIDAGPRHASSFVLLDELTIS